MSVAENGLYVVMHWMEQQRREYMHNMRKVYYYLMRRLMLHNDDEEIGKYQQEHLPGALGYFFRVATTRFRIGRELRMGHFLGFRAPGF
jgi:hypothetical protein